MISLLPPGSEEVSDAELARRYAYPEALDRPYVRVNFVASADGAATVGGVSGGLSSAPDRRVFGVLRRLAEVIVVGAQTARAEDYRGARKPNLLTGVVPRIAVLTATAALDPGAKLFTDTSVPPLVLAASTAPPDNLSRLADAGAEVVTVAGDRVIPELMVAELGARGLHRVLCEGGPRLFGDLVAADAVDELCLTIAPALAGPGAGRIVGGPPGAVPEPRTLRLVSALFEDGSLLLRYERDPVAARIA